MKKHKCDTCAEGFSVADYASFHWAQDPARPWLVDGQHIHTGRFSPLCAFPTKRQAEAYKVDAENTCTSHQNFSVLPPPN